MDWLISVLSLVILGMVVVITAQRQVLAKKRQQYWESEREIARLHEAVDHWANDYRYMEKANERMVDRYLELMNKEPIIVQPPDVAAIVREVGDSIGTAIYGRQQEALTDLQKQIRDTSMIEERIKPGEWFPDVEFDDSMGPMPAKGGWINGESNAQQPPPEDQTPSHVVINGKLVRLDGQSVFQSGVGAPMPQGGVE